MSLHKEFYDLSPKYSICNKNPFLRLKIRLKKEIVTIGKKMLSQIKIVGDYISPQDWNKFINKSETLLIDTRNDYEISIGSFENAINPNIKSFRDFPNWVNKNLVKKNISKNAQIGMYCTGGIRCEKSTSYLKKLVIKMFFILKGGILKYLNKFQKKKSLWKGECFVFDYRVSIEHGLKVGHYEMCFACRMPLSKKINKILIMLKGKSCKYCFNKISEKQKKRFNERQKQIELQKKSHGSQKN